MLYQYQRNAITVNHLLSMSDGSQREIVVQASNREGQELAAENSRSGLQPLPAISGSFKLT